MSDWDGRLETRIVGPMMYNVPTIGQILAQRKLEEGKCEALGCQQFVEDGGYCASCTKRKLHQ